MVYRSFAVLILFGWIQIAQIAPWAQNQVDPVVIGDKVQLQSNILKETRNLFVSKPTGYDTSTDRYPVLYLLDGEEYFPFTAPIVEFLGTNDRVPPMLVVGIASGDVKKRSHDLTPPSNTEMDTRYAPDNGGADTFLSFLADEVIPYVDRMYRTRPYRLLAGHSFGGLFAVYALVTKPELFSGYIAADPSLHWNNQAVVAQAEAFLTHTQSMRADFYMAATDLSDKVPGEVTRLTAALNKSAPAGLRWKFEWMEHENHMSIPLPAIYRGVESIFEEWRLSDPIALFDHGGIEAIHRRFREAGRRFGYPQRVTPPFAVSL